VSKIVRYEFMGNWFIFWLLVITCLGIPIAFLHILNSTVRIETEMDNPEEVLANFRAGKLKAK
jgi:uncharacterized membrane protein